MSESMLSVREVSARVKLSEWAIRRAIDDGQLGAYKLRGQLRIDPADLERWLAACRVDRQPSAADNVVPMTPSPSYPEGGTFRSRVRRREAA